ncbi:MAG: FAD-binding oxidoreductase, partial [Planctomycetes bacterium]|nr:FAD-binding oxidoreductase [Planctomycetota bacterium]
MPIPMQPVITMQMRRFSYWESELPPEPLPARELPRRVDILIVGAGFMGRWLAYFLSKRTQPARILVIDRDRFSYGASSRNAGFITCGQVSEMLADVEHAGQDRVIETFMQRREGIAIAREALPDFHIDPCGSTDYDPVTDDKLALMAKLNEAAGDEIFSVRAARIGQAVRP